MECVRVGPLLVCRGGDTFDPGRVVRGVSTRWRDGKTSREPFDLRRERQGSAGNCHVLCEQLGLRGSVLVTAEQVHGGSVAVVDDAVLEEAASAGEVRLPGVDGLVADRDGVALMMFYADCVPVMLWDEVSGAVGLVHAGWRGTVAGIGPRAVEAMRDAFACHPKRLHAFIAPAICGGCYAVGDEVAQAVSEAVPGGREALRRDGEGWRLDLKEANRLALLSMGLWERHVSVSSLCTSCRVDLFFSHRRDGGETGRHAAVIARR